MSQDGRQLGSSADVPAVRQGRRLVFIQNPPRHGSLPRRRASGYAFGGTWRRLALVLYLRGFSRLAFGLSVRFVFDEDERHARNNERGAEKHECGDDLSCEEIAHS